MMNLAHRASGSDDEQSSDSRKRKTYHRHSQHQTQQLEAFFNEFPLPDDKQRKYLGREIGLSPQQIKFWFQNKRTQKKTMNERSDNNTLRAENDRFRRENNVMLEAQKSIMCLACQKGSSHGQLQNQLQSLRTLRIKNVRLRVEHEGATHFDNFSNSTPGNNYIPDAYQLIPEITPSTTDKAVIIETAVSAMKELIKLLHMNEPVWTVSPTDGRNSLHRDNYDKLFPKTNHFKSANARIESSKDSAEVAMPGPPLLEAFLDPIKRKDMFPTIVTKAKTFEVVDTSEIFHSGSIYLMYEKMHILSHLVAPREFFFIRYAKHIAPLTWVIVDVSYDIFKHLQDDAPTRCWKLPSGCMIQDKSNGKSLVTWIEHVEVDDKYLTHRLYRDLVCYAYGAKRWVTILQRMCDRVACSLGLATTPVHELEGVIHLLEGRRNMMRLSHRMVKSLCQILNMSDRIDFPHLSELSNTGVRVSVRISHGIGQPNGLIVAAATSIALPISTHDLFNFLNDETRRPQWDILSSGNPVNAIARISTGTTPGNCISILQPFIPKENILILQETSIESLGASLVYAPIILPSVISAMDGEDTERIQILPSGFLISHDGKMWKGADGTSTSGSILTIALQILACHIPKSPPINMESIATVHSFISSTVQRIKAVLGCPDLD